MAKKIGYSEPAAYFPKSIRKEFQLGEYANKTTTKKTVKRTTSTKRK